MNAGNLGINDGYSEEKTPDYTVKKGAEDINAEYIGCFNDCGGARSLARQLGSNFTPDQCFRAAQK